MGSSDNIRGSITFLTSVVSGGWGMAACVEAEGERETHELMYCLL